MRSANRSCRIGHCLRYQRVFEVIWKLVGLTAVLLRKNTLNKADRYIISLFAMTGCLHKLHKFTQILKKQFNKHLLKHVPLVVLLLLIKCTVRIIPKHLIDSTCQVKSQNFSGTSRFSALNCRVPICSSRIAAIACMDSSLQSSSNVTQTFRFQTDIS